MRYFVTNALFYSNFLLNDFTRKEKAHIDNSHGVPSHYIGYMKKGSAEIIGENTTLKISTGDLFYIPKGLSYHSYWYPDKDTVNFFSFGFQNIPLPHNERFKLQLLPKNDRILELVYLVAEQRNNVCKAAGTLFLLLAEVIDDMKTENPNPKQDIVDKARCYMYRNDNYSVADVAKYCSVSESGFYSTFKELTGRTPGEEKNAIKIQRCKELLTVEGLNVEQVSEKMGFSSSSYFRKFFKKHTGQSPSALYKSSIANMP